MPASEYRSIERSRRGCIEYDGLSFEEIADTAVRIGRPPMPYDWCQSCRDSYVCTLVAGNHSVHVATYSRPGKPDQAVAIWKNGGGNR